MQMVLPPLKCPNLSLSFTSFQMQRSCRALHGRQPVTSPIMIHFLAQPSMRALTMAHPCACLPIPVISFFLLSVLVPLSESFLCLCVYVIIKMQLSSSSGRLGKRLERHELPNIIRPSEFFSLFKSFLLFKKDFS